MKTPRTRKNYLGMGLGAGILGGLLLALKYAVRKPTKARVPDTISPAIFATRVLETSRGEMVYHESGSGEPLIFVHGICLGASSYEWSKVYPEFALQHRVLAPDLLGFGESERPQAHLTAADYARSLVDFIRGTCGDEKPVLIGSGLGGAFCAYLAGQHPELVSRLILLSPTGFRDFGRQRLPRRTRWLSRGPLLRRFLYRNHLTTKIAIRHWLEQFAYANPARLEDEAVEVLATCAQQGGAEHAFFNFGSGRLSFDLAKRLPAVTVPVALLWGKQAVFPPIEWVTHYEELMPGLRSTPIEDAGIFAALEQPAAVSAAIADQLQSELRIYRAG